MRFISSVLMVVSGKDVSLLIIVLIKFLRLMRKLVLYLMGNLGLMSRLFSMFIKVVIVKVSDLVNLG